MSNIERYNLRFKFRFDKLKYDCSETITGKFTNLDSLDCERLTVKSMKVDGKEIKFRTKDSQLKFGPIKGREITIDFSGTVSQQSLMGIHESKYEGGHIITTQMEPTGARSVFPCVDNPSAKAKFKIEVQVDEKVDAISNSQVLSKKTVGKGMHFVFEETPPMSTYLFYLGVGKFEYLTKKFGTRKLAVITTPGKSKQGAFALDLLGKLIEKYEAYYKIKYPLPKAYLIGVPQFGAGAMENWGAITFRESALLVNKSVSFTYQKQIGYVIAHEFAHQWFGNLVTMKWWDDLWLNESFATFVGFKILDKIEKKWNLWEDFLREEMLSSMKKDALLSTHPIRVEVKDPDEIAEIFDSISYGKGASILRMTEQFVGEKEFREGVFRYLKAHSYSNAAGEDLWSSLSKTSTVNVSRLMKSWLEKGGFPQVRARKVGSSIIISQERFTYLKNKDRYLWQVPVFLKWKTKQKKILLKDKEIKVKNTNGLLINPKGEGYYRLLFENGLIDEVLSSKSSPEFVMKLVDDYYSFLLSGTITLPTFIDILERLRERNEYSVVLKIVEVLLDLDAILQDKKLKAISIGYLREKLKIFKEKKDDNSKVVLERLLQGSAHMDSEFREKEKKKILSYGKVKAEERTAVLLSACMEGYEKNMIWDMMKHPENDAESIRLMTSMSHFPKNEEVTEFLDYSMQKPELRGNVIYSMFSAVSNRNYRTEIWKWVSKNINSVREIFKGSSTVSFFVETLITIAGIDHRAQVQEFLESEKIPEAARAIKNGLEMLEVEENLISSVAKK